MGFNQNEFDDGRRQCGLVVLLRLQRDCTVAILPMMKKKGKIITLVNLLVTVMHALTLPVSWSGVVWFLMCTKSALLGGTLTIRRASRKAGASLLDAEIVKYAMLFKNARIILLVGGLIPERMVSQQNQTANPS